MSSSSAVPWPWPCCSCCSTRHPWRTPALSAAVLLLPRARMGGSPKDPIQRLLLLFLLLLLLLRVEGGGGGEKRRRRGTHPCRPSLVVGPRASPPGRKQEERPFFSSCSGWQKGPQGALGHQSRLSSSSFLLLLLLLLFFFFFFFQQPGPPACLGPGGGERGRRRLGGGASARCE